MTDVLGTQDAGTHLREPTHVGRHVGRVSRAFSPFPGFSVVYGMKKVGMVPCVGQTISRSNTKQKTCARRRELREAPVTPSIRSPA